MQLKFLNNLWILLLVFLILPNISSAGLIDDLKNRISGTSSKIEELEGEIQKYQEEIEKTQKEAQTLNGAIKTLNITSKQLSTDINVTRNKITNTNLTINKLELEIDERERKIKQNQDAVAETIRKIDRFESNSLVEMLLGTTKLSDFWSDVGTIQQFQGFVQEDVFILRADKANLTASVIKREGRKRELVSYKSQLADQREIVEINKSEKKNLLDVTKNKESEFQKILAEKLRQKEEFERELLDFEAQLQIAIDPSSIPVPGNVIFRWPLDIKIRITQLFGSSHFAQQNPSVYGGRAFHNGTDFGAPVGTAIRAPISGEVWRIGNTDSVRGCYSWGKWVLLKHPNGLSTLYAHLSLIRLSPGDRVSTGDIVGYTGNSGFSTGPHLHMTTYATKGVRIVPFEKIRSTTKCKGLVTPAASTNAYLDSLDYLPQNYKLSL